MTDIAIPQIAHELHLAQSQVQATVGLLDDGATVPFIARYRKEATASLDEVDITNVRDHLLRIRELLDRKRAILGSLKERALLTEELQKAVKGRGVYKPTVNEIANDVKVDAADAAIV